MMNELDLASRLTGLGNQSIGTSSPSPQPEDNKSNLIESFLKQFSTQVQKPFTTLSEAYPGAEEEAKEVQNALARWTNAVASNLNTGGAEPPDGF